MLLQAASLYSVFSTTLYLTRNIRFSATKLVSFLIIPVIIAINKQINISKNNKEALAAKPILVKNSLVVSKGLFWISHLPVHGTYWGNIVPGLILLCIWYERHSLA